MSQRFYSKRSNDDNKKLNPTSDHLEDDKISTTNVQTFSHIDMVTNQPKQVDISDKVNADSSKKRIACAMGYIQLNPEAFNALVDNKLRKGNALIVAQIAGIQASKVTHNLIPLCHQLLLDVCNVNFKANNELNRIECEATCKTSNCKTGVEMEAFVACSISLLTIYDMIKAVQKDAYIGDIRLKYKYGGKSDFCFNVKT
jgi:cyclic pyranopterin phosphate synthase